MTYAVQVTVKHWMFVEANNKEDAERLAEEAVDWETDLVEDSETIYDDEIVCCYASRCELVEENEEERNEKL